MIKKLYYILFILPFLFFNNVYAIDVDVTSTITSPNSATQGRYSGTEIYNTGTENVYSVKTRYNGQLSRIRYNLPISGWLGECFATNTQYKITMEMATDDWRNRFGSVSVSAYGHEYSTGGVTYVSYKKIYFNFKIPASTENCIDYVFVDLKSTNTSSTAFTGVSNWNLSKIIVTDPDMSSSGGTGGNSTPTPTPTPVVDYSDITNNANQNANRIINNQNDNTQDIIDNNNSNTESIIENQNQNNEQLIDSQKSCNVFGRNYSTKRGFYLDSNGDEIQSVAWYYSDYINVYEGVLTKLSQSGTNPSICFYNSDKELISCSKNSLISVGVVSLPTNTYYVRFSGNYADDQPQYKLCKNGNQAVSDSINNLNDTMKNDDIDDKTGFFSGFDNNMHGLSGIITAPLTTIQGLVNNTCIPLQIPIPFTNDSVDLPCMHDIYLNVLGDELYTIIQTVITGIISYYICLDIFRIVKGFKDPQEDKIEVLDL